MREVNLWEVKVGRMTMQTILVASETLDCAIDLAAEWLRNDKSEWNGVDRNDVKSIMKLSTVVIE